MTQDSAETPPWGVTSARLRDLWPLFRPQSRAIALGAGLGVGAAVAALAQPLAMMRVINASLSERSLMSPLLILGALLLLDVTLTGLQSWVLLRAAESVVFQLRGRMIDRILFWRAASFREFRRGDLVARFGSDVTSLRAVLADGMVEFLGAVLVLIGAVVLMIIIDPVLFFVSFAMFVLTGAVIAVFLSKITTETERTQSNVGELSADLDRTLGGVLTMIASGMRGAERDRLRGRARAAYESGLRAASWDALITPVLMLGANAAFFVVFGLGGVRVASGDLGIAEFISFVLYFGVLIAPLVGAFSSLSVLQRALGSVPRLQQVLDNPVDDRDWESSSADLPEVGASSPISVLCDGVSFGYTADRDLVIHDLNMAIAPGEWVAFVGPSGTGKTTLLQLLAGLESPISGTILMDGQNLEDMNRALLRHATISFVQQEAPVFWGTLRENLTYGVHGPVDDDAVHSVCHRLGLDQLIDRLPRGLETGVDDHGVSLSGGERQRIAIGRALLRRPRLLLLDEPTSQLDMANEARLLTLISELDECTVVMSAHRPSTASAADRIIDISGQRGSTGTSRHEDRGAGTPPTLL